MESPVLSVDYDKKEVTALVNGQKHVESYEKLIFATGSQPIIPAIKGVEIVEGNREFKTTKAALGGWRGRAGQGGTKNEAHFKAALRFVLNCRASVLRRGCG